MPPHIPFDRTLIPVARRLRTNATESEKLLWSRLRRRQILGAKFRRQHILLHYIVDFYCSSLRLVVEVDGISHETDAAAINDRVRQRALEDWGVTLIRFTTGEVFDDLNNVLLSIAGVVEDLTRRSTASKP